MTTLSSSGCSLCGLPLPDDPVEDADALYCCRGCLNVDEALDEAPEEGGSEPVESVNGETTYFHVDGMHCSTCEIYLESRARSHDGVRDAQASYAADAVRAVYDPEETSPEDIRDAVGGRGYSVHEERDGLDDLSSEKLRLVVGGFFTMLLMPWYIFYLYPSYVGFAPGPLFYGSSAAGYYLPLAVLAAAAGVVLFYTGRPMLRGAVVSLGTRHPNTNLLLATAAVSAYLYSVVAVTASEGHVYFDVSVAIVMVSGIGGLYESKVKHEATEKLGDLVDVRPEHAHVKSDDGVREVAVEELEGGETVVVREGDRAPADGVVSGGEASFDESLVTGEPIPTSREEGDRVVGGAVAVDGSVEVEVDDDADGTVEEVVDALWELQSARPGGQRVADALAAVFVPLVLVIGVGVASDHLYSGNAFDEALLSGLVVLVVSCPCALGLATPLAVAAGVRESLERGVVVTGASVFERARDADTVVFDKTGTVTTGEMEVRGYEDAEALSLAAEVETLSGHPVAEALARHADGDREVAGFESYPRGVSATVDGRRVDVGAPEGFDGVDWSLGGELRAGVESARDAGDVPVVVAVDGEPRDVVRVGDSERPGWRKALDGFDGSRTVLLTGDSRAAAREFERYPEVDEVYAEVPPEAKAETVRRLSADGDTAMVGDGVNDAPALAAADVGVAMGGGAALAADAADAVVTTDDLGDVDAVFEIAEKTRRRIRENLAWAFTYNAVALPLAVAGFINPLYAALAMASSSVLVVVNSAREM